MNKLFSNYLFSVLYQIILMITPFITTPYVARVLQPEGIGIEAYVASIVQLFILFSLLSIPLYGSRQIATKETPMDKSKEFFAIYIFQLTSTVIILGLYLIFIQISSDYKFLYIIHILSFLSTALDVSWYFYGTEQIKKVAVRNILVRLFSIVLIFLLVNESKDLPVYIFINVFTLLFGQLIMWLPLIKQVNIVKIGFLDIRSHVKPIFLLFLPQVIVQVYILVNKIILGNVSGEVEVGYYNQANKIISLGLGVITALGTVMLPRISSEFSKGNIDGIKRYSKITLQFVLVITIPLMFGLAAISTNFVEWFFGRGYEPVSHLIIIMSPIVLFVGMATVFGIQILISTNQKRKYTISVTLGALCSLVINYLFVSSLGSKATAIAILVAEGVGAFIQLYYTRNYINIKLFSKDLLKYLFLGMTMFIVIKVITLLVNTGPIFLTAIQIFSGIIGYLLGLILFKDPLLLQALKLAKDNKFKIRKGD